MNVVEKMFSGEMKMSEFIHLYKNDQNVRALIMELIPDDAKNNSAHPFWKNQGEYDAFERYNFDVCKMIDYPYAFYLTGKIGANYSLHSVISDLYKKTHPNVSCTTKYRDMSLLYINTVCEKYEGDDEVQELLENIILSATHKSNKINVQKKIVNEAVEQAFHVENRKKYPRWIQGGEWPMGKNSPMMYLRQESHGEEVHYIFRDYDTGEEKTVVQLF